MYPFLITDQGFPPLLAQGWAAVKTCELRVAEPYYLVSSQTALRGRLSLAFAMVVKEEDERNLLFASLDLPAGTEYNEVGMFDADGLLLALWCSHNHPWAAQVGSKLVFKMPKFLVTPGVEV